MVSIGHIVPLKNKIEIDIPAVYINQEIEILIMPVKKTNRENSKHEGILSLKAILGDVNLKPCMKEKAWEAAIEKKIDQS